MTDRAGTDASVAHGEGSHGASAALCALASGSSGNCSVLRIGAGGCGGGRERTVLIDLGLSPRRTRGLLEDLGAGLDAVDDVLLTHLDGDHFRPTWTRALPGRVRVHLRRRRLRRAERLGLLHRRVEVYDDPFLLGDGVTVTPTLVAHDEEGVCAFRVEAGGAGGDGGVSVGYATDVGRPTQKLAGAMRGVDLLAVESNYCPRMQLASPRPAALKRRIMGGSGHLSNEECARLVRAAGPRAHVVLLHLSRQCNDPRLAAVHHEPAPYALTIARQDAPTRWVRVGGAGEASAPARRVGGVGAVAGELVGEVGGARQLEFGFSGPGATRGSAAQPGARSEHR